MLPTVDNVRALIAEKVPIAPEAYDMPAGLIEASANTNALSLNISMIRGRSGAWQGDPSPMRTRVAVRAMARLKMAAVATFPVDAEVRMTAFPQQASL
jgi:hypothetical protein